MLSMRDRHAKRHRRLSIQQLAIMRHRVTCHRRFVHQRSNLRFVVVPHLCTHPCQVQGLSRCVHNRFDQIAHVNQRPDGRTLHNYIILASKPLAVAPDRRSSDTQGESPRECC